MASFKVEVSPEVLVWARSSAGLRTDEVAKKLKVEEARVLAWEAGEDSPTIAKLRGLGRIYRRPLAVLLLEKKPEDGHSIRDFRRKTEHGHISSALLFSIRDVRERREIALALLDETSEDIGFFSVSARITDDPEIVGGRIRDELGVSIAEQKNISLTSWRTRVEALGVLVFGFAGVEVSEARGFSLSERPLPAIGLNNKDASNGRVFTLFHELAHLALRSDDALCDTSNQDRVEQFCNHAAGAALVPGKALLAEPEVEQAARRTEWSPQQLSALSRHYGVSREVILRRLLVLGRTSKNHYAQWRKTFEGEYEKYSRSLKESKGGPAYSTKIASQLGSLYPRLVFSAYQSENITASAASGYLGVKTKHFPTLATEIALGSH